MSFKHFRFKEYRVGRTRVLIPEQSFIYTYVGDLCSGNDFMIFSNQQDLHKLGKLWSVAARFRDALVYLPIRKNPVTPYVSNWFDQGLDLVLLHHHLQFPIKEWKRVRSKMRRGKLFSVKSGTVRSDMNRYTNLTSQDYERLWDEYPHDRLYVEKRYETLFLVGSSRVFRYMIRSFLDLSRTGPQISVPGKYHDHDHLDSFLQVDSSVSDYISLTLDFYDRKTWGS